MLYALLVAVALQVPFAEQVQDAYAQQDAQALRRLLAEADARTDSLLVRYRLYPLTQDANVVRDLPSQFDDASAREWALLSGLWSYRAGEASIFNAARYGRRSANLLETARDKDPDDPYVLLIEGQSLLFRPSIAGKDPAGAAACFDSLAAMAERGAAEGISLTEAQVWHWLALREANRPDEAATLRETLDARDLAPLYRKFLDDPPEV
jgi:hypothetical protein